MIDYGASRDVVLVSGISGSGKTSFCLRLLANTKAPYRFIWDPDAQLSNRLGMACAQDEAELSCSIETGWVIYDPNSMFPGRHAEGFAWFAGWVFSTCAHLQGRKWLLVDEVWRYCNNLTIPAPLAECVQTGRVRGLSCVFATQRPNRLNESILNEVTEVVGFRTQGPNALRILQDLGLDCDRVAELPKGAFLSKCIDGRENGGSLWPSASSSKTQDPVSKRESTVGVPSVRADPEGDQNGTGKTKCSENLSPSSVHSSSPSSPSSS